MKKVLATLLAATMVFSLAACTNAGTDESSEAKKNNENTAANSGEKVDLEMWCIATESDSNRHSYEAAIKDMETEMPNVNLKWEAFENQSYKTKIKAAVSANEMPDIFFTWSCAFLGDFVKENRVYCLDDAYENYKSELPEVMMANSTYDGKHYGVPLTMNIVGLFANMDILKDAGYDAVPETYEDLIKCCDDLKAKGYTPFGCSGKETWCVTEYLESVIEKSCGADALNDIFLGKATWKNDDVASAVDTFQKMVNDGYFDPNGMSLSNDEVKNNFIQGKYAFYMNGTWNCADFAKVDGLNVKVAEFPVINADKSELGQLIGGPSDTLAVAASSENAELAADYTFKLGRLICKYGYLDGCGLPAWTPNYDTADINDLTKSVAEICANAKAYVLFGDTAQNADDANTYLSYVELVYGCQTDGTGFVDGLAKEIR